MAVKAEVPFPQEVDTRRAFRGPEVAKAIGVSESFGFMQSVKASAAAAVDPLRGSSLVR